MSEAERVSEEPRGKGGCREYLMNESITWNTLYFAKLFLVFFSNVYTTMYHWRYIPRYKVPCMNQKSKHSSIYATCSNSLILVLSLTRDLLCICMNVQYIPFLYTLTQVSV